MFREDKQDITAHQIEALSEYCNLVVRIAMQEPEDEAWIPEDKQAILNQFCFTERFRVFFDKFKQKKIEEGDKTWVNAEFPKSMKQNRMKQGPERGVKRKRYSSPSASGINHAINDERDVSIRDREDIIEMGEDQYLEGELDEIVYGV